MTPYIAEFVGTMILILLGDGVVANVNLNKSGMKALVVFLIVKALNRATAKIPKTADVEGKAF